MEEQDAGVIELARSGDGDAFRRLVEGHSRNVFRLAFRMTGNEQDAEDVVQETFLRAYRQLKSYESRSSFATWLFRIASNYSLDLIRSRRRRNENRAVPKEDGGELDPLEFLPARIPGPDRIAMSSQVQQRIAAALDELTAQERTAFVLRHFEGLSIQEIGESLGTSANATKHSVFRAVQKLRRNLEPFVSVSQ